MEHFEIHALETYQSTPPRICLLCIDVTFVVIKQQEQDFFHWAHQIHTRKVLQLTISLFWTAILKQRKTENHCVIKTLYCRTETVISNPTNVKPETDHIRNALEVCGYPNSVFEKAKEKGS